MAETYRYKAFISYSHADKKQAEWLFRRIETFRTPRPLVGADGLWGPVAARLTPVFRDREELSTAHALGEVLTAALQSSEFLIVLCSPASANSRWVNEEIKAFRAMHGAARVLAIIATGEPGGAVGPGLPGCFPPALLAPAIEGGAPEEPIAADLRGDGDGDKLAFLKLAAGLLGVGLDDLVHREARRRQKVLAGVTAIASTASFLFAGIALFALEQRDEARRQEAIAADERDTATSALDYLVGIFRIANPATENAKTITALTVLERGLKDIDTTFTDKPKVQAKLLGVMGDVYANLGAVDLAAKTLEAAIAKPEGAIEDRLDAQLRLADVLTKAFKLEQAETLLATFENDLNNADGARAGQALGVEILRGRLAERRAEIEFQRARDDEAIAAFAIAKEHFAKGGGEARVLLARASSSRGVMLSRAKRFDEARRELEFAIALQKELHGAEHLETAAATHNLAYMFFEAGDLDPAETTMAEAVAIYDRVLEPTHHLNAVAATLLGRIREADGDFMGAVEAHRKAVAVEKAVYGPASENVGYGLLYLSLAQAKSGAPEDGLKSLDEAQAIYDVNFKPGDFNHGDIKVYRALVLGAAGRRDEALALCTDGLKMLADNLNPGDPYLTEMKGNCDALAATPLPPPLEKGG